MAAGGDSIGQDGACFVAFGRRMLHGLRRSEVARFMMILLNGPNTPFGRLALATALELGVAVENRVINVYGARFLDAINPLRQIPTLVLEDERALFDSRVICAYFASLRPEAGFAPASDWAVQTRCSLATDIAALAVSKGFHDLKAPVSMVTAPHTPVPFSPVLEALYIPSVERIEAAVHEVLSLDEVPA